ncbi:hypothetical protein [Legionella erythra]|uniref:Uncharacterized protein n=1 Tax=Legionella erythra TaxID=448 RepID=A0A0W0TW40_LEGER|nr:hypothetical protein [Legionella erythra]KTC99627.1 hypothetical protein Lery_0528 [Legionella erythra]
MPRQMLYSNDMNSITEKHLTGNSEWEKKDVLVPVSFIEMNVTYFYNKDKNFVIIASPLAVNEGAGDAVEPSYEATIRSIENQVGNGHFGIGCSLLGKGTGERHYIALFKEKGAHGKISMFDSKISAPNQFFNSSESPSFFEKARGFIKAPFKALGLWAFGIGKEIKSSFLGKDVIVHRLATQPFFDGVSCGFHASGAVLMMADLIGKGVTTTEEITSSITSDKCLDLKSETLLKGENEIIPVMNSSLGSLISSKGHNSGKSCGQDDEKKNEIKATDSDVLTGQGKTFSEVNETSSHEPKFF